MLENKKKTGFLFPLNNAYQKSRAISIKHVTL